MARRRITLVGTLGIAFFHVVTASAQEVAKPAPPDATNSIYSVLFLVVPFVFVVLLIGTIRRSKRLQPMMDRSLLIAEENLQISKEMLALQKETNRLLGQLVAARGHVE